jgi:hypothetical protein
MRQLVILLSLGCASCAMGGAPVPAGTPGQGQAPAVAAKAGTLAEIRELIGSAACTDSSQCHSLPVGARACGGPEYYLAWSSATTTAGDQLRALGERYKAERQVGNAASGRISDCRYAMDPGAVCTAGACRLGTGPLVR